MRKCRMQLAIKHARLGQFAFEAVRVCRASKLPRSTRLCREWSGHACHLFALGFKQCTCLQDLKITRSSREPLQRMI